MPDAVVLAGRRRLVHGRGHGSSRSFDAAGRDERRPAADRARAGRDGEHGRAQLGLRGEGSPRRGSRGREHGSELHVASSRCDRRASSRATRPTDAPRRRRARDADRLHRRRPASSPDSSRSTTRKVLADTRRGEHRGAGIRRLLCWRALADRVLTPVPCTLEVDGVSAPFDRVSLVCASVVRDLGIGIRLLYRAAEENERFHVVATPLGPSRLGPQLPFVLAGRPLLGARNIDALAASLDLRFAGASRRGRLCPRRRDSSHAEHVRVTDCVPCRPSCRSDRPSRIITSAMASGSGRCVTMMTLRFPRRPAMACSIRSCASWSSELVGSSSSSTGSIRRERTSHGDPLPLAAGDAARRTEVRISEVTGEARGTKDSFEQAPRAREIALGLVADPEHDVGDERVAENRRVLGNPGKGPLVGADPCGQVFVTPRTRPPRGASSPSSARRSEVLPIPVGPTIAGDLSRPKVERARCMRAASADEVLQRQGGQSPHASGGWRRGQRTHRRRAWSRATSWARARIKRASTSSRRGLYDMKNAIANGMRRYTPHSRRSHPRVSRCCCSTLFMASRLRKLLRLPVSRMRPRRNVSRVQSSGCAQATLHTIHGRRRLRADEYLPRSPEAALLC